VIRVLLLICTLALGTAQAEEVKLVHGGLTLNANLEKAQDWPAGPVVLMTHGTLAHGRMEIMATLQSLFAARGISSLAITLSLGLSDRHGMYDCAVPHDHRNEDSLGEIGAWLQWLKMRGSKQVVLLGHSRGADQSAWFAAEHDDPLVSALILIAPGIFSPEKQAADYRQSFGKDLAPVLARAQALVAAGKPQARLEHTDLLYCKNTTVTARALISYYGPEVPDTIALLQKVNKPVLVFAGSEDTTVPGIPERMQPLADAGKLKLVVIDGADHFFRDLYAEDVADAIADFIEAE